MGREGLKLGANQKEGMSSVSQSLSRKWEDCHLLVRSVLTINSAIIKTTQWSVTLTHTHTHARTHARTHTHTHTHTPIYKA